MKPHTSCREAKAKKEPSPKISERKTSTIPNEIVFLDISTIKKSSSVTTLQELTKPNWRFIVNDYSELVTGYFFENKDDMVEPTCELFHLWK